LIDLSATYKMRAPLECLAVDPPSKSEYREYVLTKITAYYEQELRKAASTNSCIKFLHVGMTGLRGKHHPAIANIKTTVEVAKMRPHLKMMCGNLLTHGAKFEQSGIGSPHCRLCDCHINDSIVPQIYKLSRDLCYVINKRRNKLLKEMKDDKTRNLM
jgi:hypothetical protein